MASKRRLTPTKLALKHLEQWGWMAADVETKRARITYDLWNFADILAIGIGPEVMLLQVTTASNYSSRKRKVGASGRAAAALGMGCRVEVWAYYDDERFRRGEFKLIKEGLLCSESRVNVNDGVVPVLATSHKV